MSHSPIEGFEQVENLDSDEDDEYEEEEVNVLLAWGVKPRSEAL